MNNFKRMSIAVLFYVKRSKLNRQSKSPIFLRLTINGRRTEISINRSVQPDLWDSNKQIVRGRSLEADSINHQIRILEKRVYDEYNKFIERGESISVDKLKSSITGQNRRSMTLLYAFEQHNGRMKTQIGKEYASGTYQRYATCQKIVFEFLKSKYGKNDILLEDIDLPFIKNFDYYLRTERNCCNNTTIKYVKNFKRVFGFAKEYNWVGHDPFIGYRNKLEEVDKEVLSEHELTILAAKEFDIPRLEQIRDIFIFCCYTGLAFSDAKKLTDQNIVIGMQGKNWLHVNRTKTNVPTKVPLLGAAQDILNKYKEHPYCLANGCLLPIPSNQKYNAYLKEIADLCGINKHLTSHSARHTFATTVTLNNRVPLESVSKMLGHRSIKTTQHYSKVLETKLYDDMQPLIEKYGG